ncbi:hypothetical protein [Solirubrobacter soli]|uniref:hypothetical protein n=1 Tax=Solirubrobacter soli TaxID=363832 RepID=UPI0004167F55|nr:hypothetical protein [Solirubrobacter soli]
MQHLFEATLTESTPERRFRRTVTLEDAIGVGSGPQTERTAMLVRAFETQNDVLERYYGSWIAVAVALVTDRGRERLEISAAPDVRLEQDVEELLFRAISLYRQVDLTFDAGRDRALCLRMLYGVISGLFKELDRNAANHVEGEVTRIEYLTAALDRAEGYFRRAAQRRAQMRYLGGVIGGLTVIAGVGALLSLGLAALPDLRDEAGMYLTSLIAGGMGALLSVLYGMTSGNLRLHTLFANAESGRGPLVAAGALRPLLGALSGTVVYVLLQSGFIPLQVPDGAAGTHFFIAIAILAGFSERWARGVLAGTEERVAGSPELKMKGSTGGR